MTKKACDSNSTSEDEKVTKNGTGKNDGRNDNRLRQLNEWGYDQPYTDAAATTARGTATKTRITSARTIDANDAYDAIPLTHDAYDAIPLTHDVYEAIPLRHDAYDAITLTHDA